MANSIINPNGIDITTSAVSNEVPVKDLTSSKQLALEKARETRRVNAKKRRDAKLLEQPKSLETEPETIKTESETKSVSPLEKVGKGVLVAVLSVGITIASHLLIKYLKGQIIGLEPETSGETSVLSVAPEITKRTERNVESVADKVAEYEEKLLEVREELADLDIVKKKHH